MPEDFQPPPSPRLKSGNGWKWLAIGCGGTALLLVALVGVGGYFAARNMGISTDSAEIEEKANALFAYSIPGGSQGTLTMNIFGIELIQITSLETPPNITLMMGTLPVQFQTEATREEFLKGFQESFSSSSNPGITFTSQRTESRVLCDQPVVLTIQEGEDSSLGESSIRPAVSYMTTVDHNNKALFTWIMATGDRAADDIETVFSSLKCQ